MNPTYYAQRRARNAHLTYYSREYAEALRPVIHSLVDSPGVRSFTVSATGRSVWTIYLYIQRAWLYLIDHDNTGYYARARKHIMVKKHLDRGYVQMVSKAAALSAPSVGPLALAMGDTELPVTEVARVQSWRKELDSFVDGPAMGRLTLDGLNMTIEEMNFVRASLAGLDGLTVVACDERHLIVDKSV